MNSTIIPPAPVTEPTPRRAHIAVSVEAIVNILRLHDIEECAGIIQEAARRRLAEEPQQDHPIDLVAKAT